MYRSKIPLRKWATACYLHGSRPGGISALQLSRDLQLNYRSAWFLLHRIRKGWPDQEPLRSREAEMDEALFGGREKNKHSKNRLRGDWMKDKTIGAGIRDRETRRVAVGVVPDRKRKTLRSFAEKHGSPGGTLYTDAFTAYSDFGWKGRHETVNHNKGEFVRGDVHTKGMESFWATAKGTVRGTYRHVSPKYFPRYLNEIAGRHNIRGKDILEQMKLLVSGMVGKRLTYRDLEATEILPVPYTHHLSKKRANLSE